MKYVIPACRTYKLILLLLISLKSFCQNTYVPDDNFEQALIEFGYDTILDNFVLTANINTVASLEIWGRDIADLTGIEDFTALENLSCGVNLLTEIDVTQNTNLTTLECAYNQLTNLDVMQNTALTSLHCQANQLTSLNITQNTTLTSLHCFNNYLTSLDVTQNTALTSLWCHTNQIPNLDVTQNTALVLLYCYANQLTNLDVSQNTDLNYLLCEANQLISLDVSQNTTLIWLRCSENQLTSLNVKNGNNTNVSMFNSTNNPNLICIEVDDATYSTANWTNIDPQTYFSEDCDLTVNEIVLDNIFIYPNPVNNNFYIDNYKLQITNYKF